MKLCLALLIFGKSLLHLTEFVHLYNKTRNSYIYMLPIAGHSWVAGGCFRLNKIQTIKKKNFYPRATSGLSASL